MSYRRTALVTGGTGNLGRAVVLRLLDRGDRVIVPWYSQKEVDRIEAAVDEHAPESASRLELLAADLTSPEDHEGIARRLGDLGELDGLVNLAGGFLAGSVEETDLSDWERMMAMNATTAFLTTRTCIPFLKKARRAAIVNVTSAPAVRGGGGGMVAYTASKAAVAAMTAAMAKEFEDDGVSVNAIAPTTIDTEPNRRALPNADRSKWVSTEEIADMIAHLTGEAGRSITGNVVVMGR